MQTLSAPMILAFSDSAILGTTETICASGMLATSVIVGVIPIKKGYVKLLSASLFCAGLFMAGFGLRENILLICAMGFLFFAMLPLANTSLDYFFRSSLGLCVYASFTRRRSARRNCLKSNRHRKWQRHGASNYNFGLAFVRYSACPARYEVG